MAEASVPVYDCVCAQYPPKLPATMTNVLDVFHDVYLTSMQFVSESCYQLLITNSWRMSSLSSPSLQL